MKKNFVALVLIGLAVGLTSCMNDSDNKNDLELLLDQTGEIDAYLAANNLTAVKDVSGVRMVITELGTGFPAHINSTIDVDYVGKLFTTNQTFDQGNTSGVLAGVDANGNPIGYIDGWKIAFTTLPEGSRATLYIPSYFGYGEQAQGSIPANSILVFDVVFNEIKRSSAELQRLAADSVAIDDYLDSKGITAVKDPSGLRYFVNELGNGPYPGLYDKIQYHVVYKLLTNDTKIVGEYDLAPQSGNDNRVVDQPADGLKLGLQKVPVGTKITYYVPSGLAFGTAGATQGSTEIVPPNANVIIMVEFTQIIP